MSTVYLIHFSEPVSPGLHTCQHYLGSAEDLDRRIAQHAAGAGSRLCQVAKERGLSFTLARTWPGGRDLERRLKRQHNAPKLCPICRQMHQEERTRIASFSWADVPELEF